MSTFFGMVDVFPRREIVLSSPSRTLVGPGAVCSLSENIWRFPHIVANLCTDNTIRNRAALFRKVGLNNYPLTPSEASRASRTPNMSWRTFSKVFGGTLMAERPCCRRVEGYGNFLCTNNMAQPFAPRFPGEPGVILYFQDADTVETTNEMFHLLVSPSAARADCSLLRYSGIYTRVPLRHTALGADEWLSLSSACRNKWILRLQDGAAPHLRAIHARASLRNTLGHDPSPADVRRWMRKYKEVKTGRWLLNTAFKSGKEKLRFEVVKCVGYDVHLATIIRNEMVVDRV
ncbi:hypothetical protein B0F90DRAFT_1738100 [Multifurca ochricompacta]|uniref:DUF6697 domain-containing protein n=1 Tax=Multifurca ochricompacta TaxID=376703 RepID=A0AAD4M171_9AGAM|nr:hypothetical protein B0F90DRAFT_1738100 [Multifurca ochricompacta]